MSISRKKLALFVGQADEAYQSHFISGFNRKAIAANYDVCIFSMYRKYQDTHEKEKGESNIFSLMNPDKFAGVVILKDTIQTENAAHKLEERLIASFDKPVIVVEKESEHFLSIYTDHYKPVFDLVTHLIEVHGCRDIAFLSGKKRHEHSKQRLQAYLDAMEKAGLSVSDDRIFYGDYWYQSGEVFAEQLISQGGKIPDAVACANDQMAIGLCKALTAHGIRIPEDIAVVGYDSTYEGQTSPCSLTSALIPAYEFGEYTFDRLMSMINGTEISKFSITPELLLGQSCGCHNENMPDYRIQRKKWGTEVSEEGFDSVFNTMGTSLLSQNSLTEYLNSVYSYVYQLGDIKEFHLCLDSRWENMGNNIHVTNDGYNEKMIHAIKYYSDHKKNMTSLDDSFPSSDMLPDLDIERDTPAVYIFTPVFFSEDCFGYAAVRYNEEPNSYDDIYRRWIDLVNKGFEMLKRNVSLKVMHERLERMRTSKFSDFSYALDSLDEKEMHDYRLVTKILDENLLNYHFQPIISTENGEIYAYEALMRSRTNTPLSPLKIIKYAAMQERLFDVERFTFLNVLRIINEKNSEFGNARIFINSIPGVIVNDDDLSDICNRLEKCPKNIVIELTEEAELNDADLMKIKHFYRQFNIDIAVDDYGTGYSNVSNLLRYMPNYVKIDQALISNIGDQPRKQHFVREIIDFCHDNDILALAEGVETADELRTAIHLGVDLIQGFYVARPSADIITHIDEKCRSEIRQFYQERIDGEMKKIYYSGKTNRIQLAQLLRDGFSEIVVGADDMVYKDISIIGIPKMKTDIHLRIESGYSGRIVLEEVYFSNIKKRPCIELGENADVTLVLLGTNTLSGSGIQVPATSRLITEGKGNLEIQLNDAEFYGIGNNHYARHGELIFDQDGSINISCHGQKGICIGSGLGGKIQINRGEYNINAHNESVVAIGALTGKVDLKLNNGHIEANFTVNAGVLLGSLENDAIVYIEDSSIFFSGFGKRIAVIGSITGKKVGLTTKRIGTEFSVTSDAVSFFGSLYGHSDVNIVDSALKLECYGKEALIFGGYNSDSVIKLINSDTQAVVRSAIGKDTLASDENVHIINGRNKVVVNDEAVVRKIVYDYT